MAKFEYLQRSENFLFADPKTLDKIAEQVKEHLPNVQVNLSESDCEVVISTRADDVRLQNLLGLEGWELITVDAEGDSHYKRKI